MNKIIESLNCRIQLLKKAIKQAEKEDSFPEGRLRISKTDGRVRYYEVNEKGDTSGKYLHKKEQLPRVKQLAQKEYNKKFLKMAGAEQKNLEKFLERYQKQLTEFSYEEISNERKQLVTPYILPDDLLAQKWLSKAFKPNPYKPEKKIFATRRGDMVRSKSEAIIADMLYEMGIPYHYEFPLKMCNGEIKYPDFTLLNLKTREVVYFEHFGRMDDEDYRKRTMEKMDLYRTSGIYPGKNLMFTYETEENPIDIRGTRKMLSEVFLD